MRLKQSRKLHFRDSTHSRNPSQSRLARQLSCALHGKLGAGEGNRTLVCSLGSCRSAIELHPQALRFYLSKRCVWVESADFYRVVRDVDAAAVTPLAPTPFPQGRAGMRNTKAAPKGAALG